MEARGGGGGRKTKGQKDNKLEGGGKRNMRPWKRREEGKIKKETGGCPEQPPIDPVPYFFVFQDVLEMISNASAIHDGW